jgi:MFS family permease
MPLVATWVLQTYGLAATYAMLAGLSGVSLLANLFIIDRPPGAEAAANASGGHHGAAGGGRAMAGFLRSPKFWSFALAFAASGAGSIILTSHMAPMALSWGMSAGLAAALLSIQSFAGIAGNVLFGWLADRLGGVKALALVVFDAAVLWMLLLLHPPFALTAVIIGLIGVHGAGVIPALSVALSQAFGRENFSSAFGLANLVNLPFSVICVPAAALVYARTGSYSGAIVGQAVFLILASVLVIAVAVQGSAKAKRALP